MLSREEPHFLRLGTWLEPESICYPSGRLGLRRALAINVETGKPQVVRTGIPDTYFTLPVKGGGYLDIESGILRFHPPRE